MGHDCYRKSERLVEACEGREQGRTVVRRARSLGPRQGLVQTKGVVVLVGVSASRSQVFEWVGAEVNAPGTDPASDQRRFAGAIYSNDLCVGDGQREVWSVPAFVDSRLGRELVNVSES